MTKKCVIILSGGVDSTTLTYDLLNQGYEVYPITFDYGQKQQPEITAARNTCKSLGLKHLVFDLSSFSETTPCALTSEDIPIPSGNTYDEVMKSTIVASRNLVMLSIAISYAQSHQIPEVYYGAQGGDSTIYPDCRPEFVEALNKVSQISDHYPIMVFAPYTSVSKSEIVKTGISLNVDYRNTWSCYTKGPKPCGKCGACTERLQAFSENNSTDPLNYEV